MLWSNMHSTLIVTVTNVSGPPGHAYAEQSYYCSVSLTVAVSLLTVAVLETLARHGGRQRWAPQEATGGNLRATASLGPDGRSS